MANIHLIGTHHCDLSIFDLGRKALDQVNPDILVLESNPALNLKSFTKRAVWSELFKEFDISEDLQHKFSIEDKVMV